MKKVFLLAITIVILSMSEGYAQKAQSRAMLSKVSEPINQILSSSQQQRLQRLQNSNNYLSVTVIQIGDIEKEIRNSSVSFDLPNKLGKVTATSKNLDFLAKDNFVWNGETNKGQVMLARENGRTYGQIRKNGRVFDIQDLGNGYASLIEYDMEKLNLLGCGISESHEDVKTSKSTNAMRDSQGNLEMAPPGGGSSENDNIRVLVLYTAAAAATGMNMTDLANTARNQWLTAQINSNVQSDLQIVGVEESDFTENSTSDGVNGGINIFTDINLLKGDVSTQQLRDQFEADIVVLLTNGNYTNFAGVVPIIGPAESDAYGIVQAISATSTMTFIHETAHIFGARHQFSLDNTPGDAHGFDWSTGWWLWKDEYRSIMRTFHTEMERVPYFSNPQVTHEGEQTGENGTAFNSKTLNLNGSVVASFRYTSPNMGVSVYGSGLADGGEALNFTNNVTNGQSPYSYNWQADTGSGYYNAGIGSSLNITMPTDDDLQINLTVTDVNGQTATDYHFVMNSFENGGGCTQCPDNSSFDMSEEMINPETELDEYELFPNPSSDLIQLISKDGLAGLSSYQVIDINGKMIVNRNITAVDRQNNLLSINISNLKSGVYFVKLIGLESQSFRFVKE